MKRFKRIIALVLAAALCAALLTACKKKPAPAPGETTAHGETITPQGGASPGEGTPRAQPGQTGAQDDYTEAPGQKTYSSPKRIPTVKIGKDYTNGGIPDGVAEIFSLDGKLLFTYVTRWEGDDQTRTNRDFYTLFEYNPADGKCSAVSPEVGYIMRIGDRFLYDKAGVGIGAANFWHVPYFTNNSAWTDEKQITGIEARKLISAPATALIKGKEQPYTVRRTGTAVTIDLPESGETLGLTLDAKAIGGKAGIDGLMIDIRGAAREKLWLSVGSIGKDGALVKELYCVPLAGGAPKPVRYDGKPIWVDPIGGTEGGVIYGYSVLDGRNRALVRVDAATEKAQLLTTVREAVWHCVANDAFVLYEVPKSAGKVELAHKRITAAQTPAGGE